MNNSNRLALAATCLLAILAAGPGIAQDKAKAAPAKDERDRKVFVDNERVLVSEVRYKPGATSGMQERRDRVVRALTDGTLEKTFKDGRKETITWKANEVKFLGKETYAQKNTGKTDLVLYTVSLK